MQVKVYSDDIPGSDKLKHIPPKRFDSVEANDYGRPLTLLCVFCIILYSGSAMSASHWKPKKRWHRRSLVPKAHHRPTPALFSSSLYDI